MCDFCVFIPVKPFVKQWLLTHYDGEPIAFPSQSLENAVIKRFTMKLPKGKVPELQKEGEVAIKIPESKAKPASTYYYLGALGKEAVEEVIEDNFKLCLWNEIWSLYRSYENQGISKHLNAILRAWMEHHGISIRYEETIKQRFYRIREAYRKKGIDLIRK